MVSNAFPVVDRCGEPVEFLTVAGTVSIVFGDRLRRIDSRFARQRMDAATTYAFPASNAFLFEFGRGESKLT